MSSCSIFKQMKVENLTPSPSLDLGGLGIQPMERMKPKVNESKNIMSEQLKTCIEGEC
jgi:hypothetical protein